MLARKQELEPESHHVQVSNLEWSVFKDQLFVLFRSSKYVQQKRNVMQLLLLLLLICLK